MRAVRRLPPVTPGEPARLPPCPGPGCPALSLNGVPMRIFYSSLTAAAALLAMSGAAVVTYTVTGALTDGHDVTGMYGPVGQSLAGAAFTAKFFRDDAAPGAT